MPVYEYECEKCGKVSTFFERLDEWHWLRHKCQHCGSRKTRKVLSTFAPAASRSHTDMLNELKGMGNVTFVPQQRPPVPPEVAEGGKCPYCGSGPDGQPSETAPVGAAAQSGASKP